jgi:hypothetical protein
MCLGVCASLVVWSLTLLLDDPVSDSLLALVPRLHTVPNWDWE